MDRPIACVTGATGMVGGRICDELVRLGYRVRVLSRKKKLARADVDLFNGDIVNEKDVEAFMQGAKLCFHCAAELKDQRRMWQVNVRGTENVLKYAKKSGVSYFCYLSSIGVIGISSSKLVDEQTLCNPQNTYEKSKWAAEQIVARGIQGCKVIILRPTTIIDERKLHNLILPEQRSWINFVKVFIKGGECTHIVHAKDVAAAAVYFINYPLEGVNCYIISCDFEPLNTLAEVWAFYHLLRAGKAAQKITPVWHLPLWVPYLLRRLILRKCNMGDVRYSSEKLMKTGFVYRVGLKEAVRRVATASGFNLLGD